ncbi:MAG: GxxExxY protein [Gemmataceae bacterium]
MSQELIHKDLSEAIIGASMRVLNTLKPGLEEKRYERALGIELRKRGHKVDHQRQFPVYYEGENIGTLIPDRIVDDLVIADPNVVAAFNETHIAQRIDYLNITDLKLAFLLNFKNARRGWKRIVRRLLILFFIRVIRVIRG